MNTEVTPDNAASATPVAYTGQDELDAIAAGFSTACTFGTYSERQGRTVPVFDATTVTALEAEVASLRALLVSVTNPDGSPNLDAAQLGAAESYRVAAINANSRADAAERRVGELEAAIQAEGRTTHSHRCRKCLWPYTPARDESEDCPKCGHDGSSPATKESP